MVIRKVCPIVLRNTDGQVQFLAFEHPLAGRLLVKGTVEQEESDEVAARRELEEESGISIELPNLTRIGASNRIVSGQEWIFFETTLSSPPDHWTFKSNDDGGQVFRFFWQELDTQLDDRWHGCFHAALDFYRSRRPTPPPDHPSELSCGWSGGGVGRNRRKLIS